MTILERLVADHIAARGAPITFAEYMELALYEPEHGYYSSGRVRTGWGGDFVTSSEIDPAYGQLWTRLFEEVWHRCGSPGRFELVEIGPGEGSFAAAVLGSAEGGFGRALHLHLIEPAPAARARQAEMLDTERVTWATSIEDVEPVSFGCIFANEVLDNQPVHVFERRRKGVVELHVGLSDAGIAPLWLPATSTAGLNLDALAPWTARRVEVSPAARALVRNATARLGRGLVAFVDYGDEREDLVSRTSGTLVAYSSRGVSADVLDTPGETDLTAHVDWTMTRAALKEGGTMPVGPRPQRRVLARLGLSELDDGLRRAHAYAVADGRGAEAVRLLSRRHALRALSDEGGLGALQVMAGLKGIEVPTALL